ncbi:hypothetical protein CCP4SC76_7760008 [Gammaproteobacteria bacterium]
MKSIHSVLIFGSLALLTGTLALSSGHEYGEREDHEHHEREQGHHEQGRSGYQPPVMDAAWQKECGACHLAYQPALLPEGSWRKIMEGLEQHFGTNASLDAETTAKITDYLVRHSDKTRHGDRNTLDTPMRITETAEFKAEHAEEISPAVWKNPKIGSPANCNACHTTAEQGNYSEHNIIIPR